MQTVDKEADSREFNILSRQDLPTEEQERAKQYWAGLAFEGYKAERTWSIEMARHVLQFAPRRVLEFGCNAGKNLRAIRTVAPQVEVYGIDINRAAIEYARSTGLACGIGDETTLRAMPGGTFDVVFTISVLDHLPDPRPAFSELKRLARNALILHEPWLGQEGRVTHNRDRLNGKMRTTTPFSYSWDYEALARELAPDWRMDTKPSPIPSNIGKYYNLYVLTPAA
jgi:SAM-dependent methyltransferase